jgi:hypothetical protein
MSSSPATATLIPVGIDLGSREIRISTAETVENDDSHHQIVSNAQGHRSTIALAVAEENSQDDDNKKRSTTKQQQQQQHYVFGDAARTLLEKERKPLVFLREQIMEQSEEEDGNNNNNDSQAGCASFFGHCARLSADSTACKVSQLRVVVSTPVDASTNYAHFLQQTLEKGLRTELEIKLKQKHPLVLGTVSDPAAVCLAHGILDNNMSSSASSISKTNILVLDGGASGLTVSHLQSCSSTSPILQLVRYERLQDISGPVITKLLAQHVASLFERQNRLPSNTIYEESKKARIKLERACEGVLSTLTTTRRSNVHVTIESLFEGMDCHVDISPPRWDMLVKPLLDKAQKLLETFLLLNSQEYDAVLTAGSLASLLTPLVDRVLAKSSNNNNNKSLFRGLPTISPQEAVAIGCARHAAACISHDLLHSRHAPCVHDVPTSPVEIGIGSLDESTTITETVIGIGMPLPAHVVHCRPCNASTRTLAVWQLQPSRKILAELQDLPAKGKLEVLVELTSKGDLSVAVQGGPEVRI